MKSTVKRGKAKVNTTDATDDTSWLIFPSLLPLHNEEEGVACRLKIGVAHRTHNEVENDSTQLGLVRSLGRVHVQVPETRKATHTFLVASRGKTNLLNTVASMLRNSPTVVECGR